MKEKIHGTVFLREGYWIIKADPHVLMRLKAVFSKVSKYEFGEVKLKNTPENAKDILWFTQRYPLKLMNKDILTRNSKEYDDKLDELERIIQPHYKYEGIYNMVLPPRQYQIVADRIFTKTGFLLVADEVGLGKAQPLSSKVLTPNGWKLMGEIRKGDKIINVNGTESEVTGIYPQGIKEVYKIIFQDKTEAKCCKDHLWSYHTNNDRVRNSELRTEPLKDIMRKYKKRNGSRDCFIPVVKPIAFKKIDVPLHPYLVGVLLGDGGVSQKAVNLTTADEELIDILIDCIPEDMKIRKLQAKYSYSIIRKRQTGKNYIRQKFDKWGLRCTSQFKFIPKCYLYSSIRDRVELLKGLMDTDGYVDETGYVCQYSTSSQQLAYDVKFLVQSLGGIAKVGYKYPTYVNTKGKKIEGLLHFTLTISLPPNIMPFKLTRKLERFKPKSKYLPYRAIEDIVKVEDEECQCISTNAPGQLYLTDDCIVTHNTVTAICSITDPNKLPILVVCQPHLVKQWKEEILSFIPSCRVHRVRKMKPYKLPKADVYIISYNKLAGWVEQLRGFITTMIYDEVQELRRKESQKYKASEYISAEAKYRLGLSATPIFNYGDEMFNVMNILKDGCLGDRDEFLREWCTSIGNDKYKVDDPKAFGSYLREQFLMIRRTESDVQRELPKEQKVVHMIPYDQKILDEIKDQTFQLAKLVLEGSFEQSGQAARFFDLKLRQTTGIAKAPYVAQFADMILQEGKQVVIYAWHREVHSILMECLKEYNPVLYTGTESPAQKDRNKEAFINKEAKVIIISVRSGAGLNGLQKVAHTVIFAELDWSPQVHHQCVGRVRRDGQTLPVTSYYLIADGGSDPFVSDVLGLKKSQSDGILNPKGELFVRTIDSVKRVKELARKYLKAHGQDKVPGNKKGRSIKSRRVV